MFTADDVAQWMVLQLKNTNRLYQEVAVIKIRQQFGDTFVYRNANGNFSIEKTVLEKFRKLTDGTAIWERGDKAWRQRLSHDKPGRQQD